MCVSRNWRLLTEWAKVSFWQVGQHQKHGANSTAVSRQHVRKNPYLQHFSLNKNISLHFKQTHPNFSCSFTTEMTNANFCWNPNFLWTLDDLFGKNRALFVGRDETRAGRGVIWALLRGLCSVDENTLVFRASCWEPLLCVLISTTPIQT